MSIPVNLFSKKTKDTEFQIQCYGKNELLL